MTDGFAKLPQPPYSGPITAGADPDLAVLEADGAIGDVCAGGVTHVRAGALQRRGIFETA